MDKDRYKEEGFFIPLDYGHIVGVVWLAHEVLMIGLSNGYIVLVSAPLLMRQRKNASSEAGARSSVGSGIPPNLNKAMFTTRIFESYLSSMTTVDGAPAVLGDRSLKVLNIDMGCWGESDCLSISADIEIEGFNPKPGIFLQARRRPSPPRGHHGHG